MLFMKSLSIETSKKGSHCLNKKKQTKGRYESQVCLKGVDARFGCHWEHWPVLVSCKECWVGDMTWSWPRAQVCHGIKQIKVCLHTAFRKAGVLHLSCLKLILSTQTTKYQYTCLCVSWSHCFKISEILDESRLALSWKIYSTQGFCYIWKTMGHCLT